MNKNVKIGVMIAISMLVGLIGFLVWLGLFNLLLGSSFRSMLDVVMLIVVFFVNYIVFKLYFKNEYKYIPDNKFENTKIASGIVSVTIYIVLMFIYL